MSSAQTPWQPEVGPPFGLSRVSAFTPAHCDACSEERLEEDANRAADLARATPPAGGSHLCSGQTLSPAGVAYFRSLIGHDFGGVRIQADARAARSAHAAGALAYTMGSDIVFAASEYRPDTVRGRAVLAHELAHVAQEAAGAPARIRRKPDDAETKSTAELKEAVDRLATNWKGVRESVGQAPGLEIWVAHGDAIIKLIREHVAAAQQAIAKGDHELVLAYRFALDSDRLMYQFIAWSIVVYGNLLAMKSHVESVKASLQADDREFTGRADAEKAVARLAKLIASVSASSKAELSIVKFNIPFEVRKGTKNQVSISVTSAAIEDARPSYEKAIGQLTKAQIVLQNDVGTINQFLANARAQGALQAVEAVAEFYMVRGMIKGMTEPVEEPVGEPETAGPEKGGGGGAGRGKDVETKGAGKSTRGKPGPKSTGICFLERDLGSDSVHYCQYNCPQAGTKKTLPLPKDLPCPPTIGFGL